MSCCFKLIIKMIYNVNFLQHYYNKDWVDWEIHNGHNISLNRRDQYLFLKIDPRLGGNHKKRKHYKNVLSLLFKLDSPN